MALLTGQDDDIDERDAIIPATASPKPRRKSDGSPKKSPSPKKKKRKKKPNPKNLLKEDGEKDADDSDGRE